MLCIHHLVIDGVSWRILAEDFETVIEQLKKDVEIVLPAKTASFIEWSRKLIEYGERKTSEEIRYWEKVSEETKKGKIAWEHEESKPGTGVAEFSEEATEKLLKKSGNAYGAKIDEVMLAGLAREVGRLTGQEKLAVKIEGHGRELIHEPIEIDRTIGWFTNVYVVNLECSEENNTAIISAKDTMRGVPDAGMGYGYVEHLIMPYICFNYLGDFGGNRADDFEEYSCGNSIYEQNVLPDRITVNGQVSEGKLMFVIMSQDRRYGKEFIEKLTVEFV